MTERSRYIPERTRALRGQRLDQPVSALLVQRCNVEIVG
eukprot:COSAG03_NODE_26015_length_262_cov_0.527607_1_plen_38_part_01